ncbi:SET domain-containing protein [Phlyctema vagabunda]|uniref:SET domain-containing protein n=1 Tax=Phlyctema vagabunda TaxID=108571 RepID=A0ABR4P5I0_9HELO
MTRSFGPSQACEVIDLCSDDEDDHDRRPALSTQDKAREYLYISDDDDNDNGLVTPIARRANNGQQESSRSSRNHIGRPLTWNTFTRSTPVALNKPDRIESPLENQGQQRPSLPDGRGPSNLPRSGSQIASNRLDRRTRLSGSTSRLKPIELEINGHSEDERERSKRGTNQGISPKVPSSESSGGAHERLSSLRKTPRKTNFGRGSTDTRDSPKTKYVADDDSGESLPSLEEVFRRSASRPSTATKNPRVTSQTKCLQYETRSIFDNNKPPVADTRGSSASRPVSLSTESRLQHPKSPATSISHEKLSPQPPPVTLCSANKKLSILQKNRFVPQSVNEIEAWLEEYKVKSENEHARTCIMALRRARIHALYARKTCRDEVSPFASMASVQSVPGQRLPAEASTTKITAFALRKKFNGTHRVLVTTPVLGEISRVPKYNHHTAVRGNILEGDDDKLKYIPFFDDVDGCHDKVKEAAARKLERDLHEHHEQNVSASSRDSERQLRSQYCLTALLQQLHGICDLRMLTTHVVRHQSKEAGLDKSQVAMLLKALKAPKEPLQNEVLSNICLAWDSVFGYDLHHLVLSSDRVNDILEPKDIQSQELEPTILNPNQVIGTYTDLCCIICNTIHCQIHGGYQDKDNDIDEEMDSDEEKKSKFQFRQHIVMLYDETLQEHDRRILGEKRGAENFPVTEAKPCSDLCHMNDGRMDEVFEWSEELRGILKALTISRIPKAYEAKRPCYLALALQRPCWQVHKELQSISPRKPQANLPIRSRVNALEWKDNKKWYDNETKTLREKWWAQWTNAHDHQKRGHPEPMNRECGPECSNCGAIERLDPQNKYNHKLFTTACQNIALQRGVGKKLFVGESMIENAGYGLYIGEPAKKGDFIEEYVGEVITWSEVARRGIHNGLKETSYLFDLNNQGAIDADRQANKTRYINHGDDKDPARNCEAKILWVRGEHRIKFIAARPIREGEELLFDYGEEFITKTGLDKKLPESKKSRTRKVLEDAVGAEQALIAQSNSFGTADDDGPLRADHRGRGRKSRKIARRPRLQDLIRDSKVEDSNPVSRASEDVDAAHSEPPAFSAEDEDEDEDEDEEDAIRLPAPKRKRVIPARYRK